MSGAKVEFIEWRDGIYEDMFVDKIYICIIFRKKPHYSFSTSLHFYKTGDREAELEAAKHKVIEMIGERQFVKAELVLGESKLAVLPPRGAI